MDWRSDRDVDRRSCEKCVVWEDTREDSVECRLRRREDCEVVGSWAARPVSLEEERECVREGWGDVCVAMSR